MSKPTLVYLLRHGATAPNREVPYRLQGRTLNPELDEIGTNQAMLLGQALKLIKLTQIYTSPLIRARQTAGILARPHDMQPVIIDDLVEASMGEWEGLTWDAAKASHPDHHAAFFKNPGTVRYPGGESFLDCQQRMLPAIAALAKAHPGERIAVMSHNVANRGYLAGLLGVPIDRAREIRQANCGINIISYDGANAVVETLNSTLHLEG